MRKENIYKLTNTQLENYKIELIIEKDSKIEMFAGNSLIDIETGEIHSKENINKEYNDIINKINEILEVRKNYNKSKTDKEVKEFIKKEIGGFYFIIYGTKEDIYKNLSDNDLEKLCVLGTYMNYDNILMKNAKTPMLKKDVLKCFRQAKENRAYEFYNKFLDNKFIIENENNTISINSKYFRRGKRQGDIMKDISESKEFEYSRMFEMGIKNSEKCAIAIRLLKYLHIEYNILCKTQPYDMNLQSVDPMTLTDVKEMLGYKSNLGNLKKKLKSIKVNGLALFKFVDHKENDYRIFVNPYLIWKGYKIDSIKFLLWLFNDFDNAELGDKRYNEFIKEHTIIAED